MKDQMRALPEPYYTSRSTLLVPDSLFKRFFTAKSGSYKKVGHLPISLYLARLVEDPLLDYKLKFLKPGKWKKEYQAEGQELRRVNFYPDDRDWGRLSAISNATGYSRCYIFVYLMLIDVGLISLEDGGTLPSRTKHTWNPIVICSISVDAIERKLTRTLQT